MLSNLLSTLVTLPPLVYVAAALATILYVTMFRNRFPKNIPPFPVKPHPLLGHIPVLKKNKFSLMSKWRKETGDIFCLIVGKDLNVFINSLPLLKEAFIKHGDFMSDRPFSYVNSCLPPGKMGLAFASGPCWKENRVACLSILRRFGMGKNFMAEKINEEIDFFMQALTDLKGKPSDIHIMANATIANVICAVLIGHRFEYHDPYFTQMITSITNITKGLLHIQILSSFPWLRFLPGDLFWGRKVKLMLDDIRHLFGGRFMKEAKEDTGVDNVIKAYFRERDVKLKAGVSTHLDDENLLGVISQLFGAGTETTSATLLWSMIYAVHNPKIQNKVYKEIVDVVGTERRPSVQDRPHMSYSNAYIMEVMRIASIAPHSLPHLCTKDVEVGGYTIPKGATVNASLKEIMNDQDVWGDPDVFRPERFIGKNGSLITPEEFIPFGIGRRYCMAESLARMELFLYITSIFQRFEVKAGDPKNLPSLEPEFAALHLPQHFKLRLIERD